MDDGTKGWATRVIRLWEARLLDCSICLFRLSTSFKSATPSGAPVCRFGTLSLHILDRFTVALSALLSLLATVLVVLFGFQVCGV